jgi:DNA-3-methyladenine glycosylase II
MSQFVLQPLGPYSLMASATFLEGFAPAAYDGGEMAGHLHLAFVADGSEQIAGVCLRAQDSTLVGEVFGEADPTVVHAQVARILSLDIDGRDWPRVGKRDLVMGRLQARYPGLRPVCFFSPYEAAAWALISHRIRITQAAQIKARLAEELGPAVEIHGRREHAFPGPSRLMQLETFPGVFGHKVAYLHQLAQATLEGKLEATFLRALPPEQALEHLKTLHGIGDFSAQLILLRGAGEPDTLPTHEPRLGRAMTLAYGLDHLPTTQETRQIAEDWRPYRTWGSLLLRVMLEEETQEIARGRGESVRKDQR